MPNTLPDQSFNRLNLANHPWGTEGLLVEDDVNKSLQRLAEYCTQKLNVARVSVWQFAETCDRLSNLILFDQRSNVSEVTLELFARDHQSYFNWIMTQPLFAADDVFKVDASKSFRDNYLTPLGITSMLDVTLSKQGNPSGVLCFEHIGPARIWTDDEIFFALDIAPLFTQTICLDRTKFSNSKYQAIFNRTQEALILLQEERMIECNAAALRLFDCTSEEFFRHPPKRFWANDQPNADVSKFMARNIVSDLNQHQIAPFEWTFRTFNGHEFVAEVTLEAIQINDIKFILAQLINVAHRNELKKTIHDLNVFQQAIFDSANNAIMTTDTNGLLLSFNRTASQMLGYNSEDVVGLISPLHFFNTDEISWRAIELSHDLDLIIEPGFEVLTAKPRLNIVEEREWTFLRKDGHTFPVTLRVTVLRSHQQADISGYLITATDMTDRKNTQEQLLKSKREIEHRTHHDELTGLPNRSKLHDSTQMAISVARGQHQKLALMLIDLDRFKEINDTLGHTMGDRMLKIIGERLDALARQNRTHTYRLGGDEFAVLIPIALDELELIKFSKKIHSALRQPILLDEINLELSGSVGISIYPQHGDNSHALLRCADVAMYKAKSDASHTIIYNAEQDAHSPRRLSMMGELGTAIRENQLILHYQPRIDIANHLCVGCEALVRWQHPRLGMVPPSEFIPLAEVSDLIQPLGLWVLENALIQILKWYHLKYDMVVSINLSTRNIMDSSFPAQMERLLKKYPIPPHMLEIEITESTLINDPEKALQILHRVHDMGVSFAIDDFGTGYSCLAYLKRLPIDVLKIDRSFIHDLLIDEQDAVIVQSTLSLAHSFGLTVVAEGVENLETLTVLKAMRCEQVQGYHFSRPIPSNEFEAWYQQFNRTSAS